MDPSPACPPVSFMIHDGAPRLPSTIVSASAGAGALPLPLTHTHAFTVPYNMSGAPRLARARLTSQCRPTGGAGYSQKR